MASVVDESASEASSTDGIKRIVGRELELAELGRYLSRALRNERQIVFITGELGIGKTALADEFQRQVRVDAPGIRIARGQCMEGYGGSEAYYPILEALGQLCAGTEGESVIHILAIRAPTWLVQFPALIKSAQREMLQREIMGATRERMVREICEALEAITREKPLLLVLDDLRWADRSTIDVISVLARRRQPAKLMLIGAYRPGDVSLCNQPLKALARDLLIHRLCGEIAPKRLDEREVAEYLVSESQNSVAPDGLARLIYRYTKGNPLFMVAVLEHMQDRGLIAHENGNWKMMVPLNKIDLEPPESLRHVIELRIEQLSNEERCILEVASVTGVLFTSAVQAMAAQLDAERFDDLCEGLARRYQIVRSVDSQEFPDGTKSAGYEFVHPLYREVLYHHLSPRRSARIHLRVAERLEALYASRPSDVAPELAQHFEQGGDWLRAIKYLQLAADTAGRRFEPRQAADILQHSLKLVKKLPVGERAEHEVTILDGLAKIYVAWVREATGT
jgi:predicted ATPase